MTQQWLDSTSAFVLGLKSARYGTSADTYRNMLLQSLTAPEVPDSFENFEDESNVNEY
jgi:hypothetical protein